LALECLSSLRTATITPYRRERAALAGYGIAAANRATWIAARSSSIEAIEITAEAKGEDHPLAADSVQALASVRCEQGRVGGGDFELFRRSPRMSWSRRSAPEHPTTVDAARDGYAECLGQTRDGVELRRRTSEAADQATLRLILVPASRWVRPGSRP
jgi:hypothetical protein